MARKSRKTTRRSARHAGKRRHTRRGGYYGATGVIAPGAIEWGRGSEMGDWAVSSRGQNAIYGSGRKRRGTRRRKGGDEDPKPVSSAPKDTDPEEEPENPTPPGGRRHKHSRRHRKMKRGGDKYGAVSASYQGTGSRGLIDVAPTTTKYPTIGGPQYGAFNNHGAQPGSGFGSFVRAH